MNIIFDKPILTGRKVPMFCCDLDVLWVGCDSEGGKLYRLIYTGGDNL